MSQSNDKPRGELAESDAVVVDESGKLRVKMEWLSKGGGKEPFQPL